jgi:hypothetical protein
LARRPGDPSIRIFAPLATPALLRLWSALAFSAVGDQLYAVALGWVAIGVLGPAAGYLSAARAAIVLATALFAGGWADAWPRRTAMISADLTRAAALLALVVSWRLQAQAPAGMIALTVAVLAASEAVFMPALQSILPQLAPQPGLLVATNGLFDATDRLARLLGPGLIALIGAVVAPIHFFAVDALSFAASALAVAGLSPRLDAAPAHVGPFRQGWRTRLAASVRAVRRHRLLAQVYGLAGLFNGAWYAVFFLALPLAIARQPLAARPGSGLSLYGLVIAAYGVSNLLSNIVVGSRDLPDRPARMIFSGTALTGGGIGAMALAWLCPLPPAGRIAGLLIAAAAAGLGGPMKDIAVAALRQTLLGADEIAGAARLYAVAIYGGMLAGMLLAPSACTALGGRGVMLACSAVYLTCSLVGWLGSADWRAPVDT